MIRHQAIYYAIIILLCISCNNEVRVPNTSFESNKKLLESYSVPDWYRDAKLGIFIHWGPYCVPEYGSEWYPRLMYMDDQVLAPNGKVKTNTASYIYEHHVKYWGSPGEFGYKDFIPLFTGEQFDPDFWMQLFREAGAKYVVAVAEHHDGFAMYHSSNTRWNSVNMGPKRDVLKDLGQAADKHGLKFGASSHFAFNWDYYVHKGGFDTMDPQFADLYGRPNKQGAIPDEEFLQRWWVRTEEIIDKYPLDILWFDYYWNNQAFDKYRPMVLSHFLSTGEKKGRQVVLNTKDLSSFPAGTAVLDIERGKSKSIRKDPWQTDTSIGKNSWGYVKNWESKSADELIDNLVDIVSKNGCLLLNVGPKKDGTIPESQQEMLLEIGNWLKTNGDAIYGTRPWKVHGEGPIVESEGNFTESSYQYGSKDIRFTTRDNTVYATVLSWPEENEININSLGLATSLNQNVINSVSLLGYDDELSWEQHEDKLIINIPGRQPTPFAHSFEITFD